jgi:hypothetical protein
MGAVRAMISMTIIGAPQCRHMKAGDPEPTVVFCKSMSAFDREEVAHRPEPVDRSFSRKGSAFLDSHFSNDLGCLPIRHRRH